MATIKFLTKGKRTPSTIFVRLRDGRNIDFTLSTSKTIDPKYWGANVIKQKAEFHDKLNLENDLNDLRSLILRKRNEAITDHVSINKEWLNDIIHLWQGKNIGTDSDLLIERIESYKLKLPHVVRNGKIGVSAGTLRNYNTTIQRLKKFEQHKKQRYNLTQIDFNFHEKYLKHAQTVLGLSLNSIGKDIRNIKTVCRDAKENGFKVNEQVLSKRFNAPSEKTIFTTLTESELNAIKNKDLNGVDYLENARDWLLIGCWTGCRVGDLMQLTNENIFHHTKYGRIIQYTQNKTGKMVMIPLHPHVVEILDRLEGFPRKISDQKFNNYIKTVCNLTGLILKVKGTRQNPETHLKETGYFEKWKLIKSHTCRRSFATNHYNKMTNKQIMHITGHATEKMLLAYIGEVESEHLDDFLSLWKKEAEQPRIDQSQKVS